MENDVPEIYKSRSLAMPILIAIVCSAIVFGAAGFFIARQAVQNDKPSQPSPSVSSSSINDNAGPPTIIYKTKKDYRTQVPIYLSDDKTTVTGHPGTQDIYYGGELAFPVELTDGYLLDRRGVGSNTAFLNITYSEYSELPSTPTNKELLSKILDNDPFVEIYDCGNQFRFGQKTIVQELNSLIISGQLSSCKKIL